MANWKELVDREQVKLYLCTFLTEEEELENNINIDYMLDDWYAAKQENPLFKRLFKDSLTIEKEISYSIPFDRVKSNNDNYEIIKEYEEKIDNLSSMINTAILNKYNGNWDNFNDIMKTHKEFYFNSYCLMHNIIWILTDLKKSDKKVYTYDYEFYHIPNINLPPTKNNLKKMVLHSISSSKAIRKILKFYEIYNSYVNGQCIADVFEDIMYRRSVLLQSLQVKGTLVLSIDPMDFLTASDNKCRWTSCFTVMGNGEYKASTYSAMISPEIMICYLKDSLPYVWSTGYAFNNKQFSLNDKIWRAFVYSNDEILYVTKNYPFSSPAATGVIYQWCLENLDGDYTINTEANIKLGNDGGFMYNDCKDTDIFYLNNKYLETSQDINGYYCLSIGQAPRCLSCGQYLESAEYFICNDELNFNECCHCGYCSRENIYTDEYGYLCEECYNSLYGTCDSCGEEMPLEDLIYDEDTGELYCPDCYNQILEERDKIHD